MTAWDVTRFRPAATDRPDSLVGLAGSETVCRRVRPAGRDGSSPWVGFVRRLLPDGDGGHYFPGVDAWVRTDAAGGLSEWIPTDHRVWEGNRMRFAYRSTHHGMVGLGRDCCRLVVSDAAPPDALRTRDDTVNGRTVRRILSGDKPRPWIVDSTRQ